MDVTIPLHQLIMVQEPHVVDQAGGKVHLLLHVLEMLPRELGPVHLYVS